jgi:hypothetical protein
MRWAAAGCPYRLNDGRTPVFRLCEVRAWLEERKLKN